MVASAVVASTALAIALQIGGVAAGKAITLPKIPADKSTPVQTRISFKTANSVSVAWNTYEKLSRPCVQYGLDESVSSTTCSSQSLTYPSSRTWNNLVVLTNLEPATTYYYRIGSTNTSVNYFQTARVAGDMTPFTMTTLADLGFYGAHKYSAAKRDIPNTRPALSHTTIGRLARVVDEYEFIIHPGDLAYADDWSYNKLNKDGEEAYEAIIERFYEQLSPITARKPYMVSPGNHEADCTEDNYKPGKCPEGQSNFSDFSNRFHNMLPNTFALPKTSPAASKRTRAHKLAVPPFWYSFDYGMVHVVMLNTETDFEDAPDAPGGSYGLDAGPFGAKDQQTEFLEADLASVDRSVTPWIVVAGHRPWYTVGNTKCVPCQEAFEDILYKYGVDIAAFGHIHNLQRFDPIYKNKTDPAGYNNPKAPMYIVIGGAGNIEGHSELTPTAHGNAFAYNTHFGFGMLSFQNKTHLTVNFMDSMNGTILDTSTLYKAHDKAFVVQ